MKARECFQVSVVLCICLVPATLRAQYDTLSTIESNLAVIATLSGGTATNLALTDSTNGVIQTVGIDLVDTNKDIARRNIWLLKIAKTNAPTKLLVTGTQHAREWVSYRVVLDAAQFILDNKNSNTWDSTDSRFEHFRQFKEMSISNLTSGAQIFMVPIVNPEGYQWSKTNDVPSPYGTGQEGWRKNRRATTNDTQAGNLGFHFIDDIIPGVDLNRNWPSVNWGTVSPTNPTTLIFTSRWTNDDLYCGKPTVTNWGGVSDSHSPIMEKETEALVTLTSNHTFACLIDVHSYTGQVGWAEITSTSTAKLRPHSGMSDSNVFARLAIQAAEMITDPVTSAKYKAIASPYPTSGDILQWEYEHSGSNCLTFLIEAVNYKDYRPTNATAHAEKVLPGMLFMMFSAVDDSFASEPYATFRKPGSPPPP